MEYVFWLCFWSVLLGIICSWAFKHASVATLVAGSTATVVFHALQYMHEGSLGVFAVVSVPFYSFVAFAAAGITVLSIAMARNLGPHAEPSATPASEDREDRDGPR